MGIVDIYWKLREAHADNKGVRLSASEVDLLLADQAIVDAIASERVRREEATQEEES